MSLRVPAARPFAMLPTHVNAASHAAVDPTRSQRKALVRLDTGEFRRLLLPSSSIPIPSMDRTDILEAVKQDDVFANKAEGLASG
jgi:hypothetical protein